MINVPQCSVLVSSCDAYRDIWPYFFHFYFKHAVNTGMPVRLLTNSGTYQDERVSMLHTGDDPSWTTCLARGLSLLPEPYVLFLQEDFLLAKDFEVPLFQEVLSQFHESGGQTLEIALRADNGPEIPGTWFRESNAENLHSGLNATLWRREFLQQIVAEPGLNIWQAESRVRDCLRAGLKGMFFLKKETPPLLSYVESVKGGFWQAEAVKFLRGAGVEPDLKSRPCPPQGSGLWPKLIRSIMKRRLRRRAGSAPTDCVRPLYL